MASGDEEQQAATPAEPREDAGVRAGQKEEDQVLKSGDTTGTSDDEPPPRMTRAQTHRSIDETDSEDDEPRTRSGSKPKVKSPLQKPKTDEKAKGKAAAKQKYQDGESDDSDTPADYVHVQVGDTVMLDSGDPDDCYVALVSSVQTSQRHNRAVSTFMAQWYYKPDDVRDEVKALIKGGVLENEVFLSPHKDRNSIDAVVELCQVVSPEEYKDIQKDIKRGYREKTKKTYFVCRYKYYPGRANVKKALEVVENDAIRNGLGRPKPNVGDSYQATIPEFIQAAPTTSDVVDDSVVPWKLPVEPAAVRPRQMWSPLAVKTQSALFQQFRDLVDTLKFSVGNIVKTYRQEPTRMGHLRGIILQYLPSDSIRVCLSTGQVLTVLKSDLCSPLSDDLAMQHFYLARFNLSQAALDCSKTILDAQRKERAAFRREVALFAQVAAERAASSTKSVEGDDGDSARKRRK